MVEDLPPFFYSRLFFWRAILAIRALRYIKNVKLFTALFSFFCYCPLLRAFSFLDKNTNPYGETPFSTLDKMARKFGVTSKDVVYDLGSGRGLGVLWWATQVGCTAYGVENYSYFVQVAKRVQEHLSIVGADFIEGDFFEVDLSGASVIYLYGTALEDNAIYQLLERFKQLGPHVKIISVSYPLSEYAPEFKTVDRFQGALHWGKTEIYLNQLL